MKVSQLTISSFLPTFDTFRSKDKYESYNKVLPQGYFLAQMHSILMREYYDNQIHNPIKLNAYRDIMKGVCLGLVSTWLISINNCYRYKPNFSGHVSEGTKNLNRYIAAIRTNDKNLGARVAGGIGVFQYPKSYLSSTATQDSYQFNYSYSDPYFKDCLKLVRELQAEKLSQQSCQLLLSYICHKATSEGDSLSNAISCFYKKRKYPSAPFVADEIKGLFSIMKNERQNEHLAFIFRQITLPEAEAALNLYKEVFSHNQSFKYECQTQLFTEASLAEYLTQVPKNVMCSFIYTYINARHATGLWYDGEYYSLYDPNYGVITTQDPKLIAKKIKQACLSDHPSESVNFPLSINYMSHNDYLVPKITEEIPYRSFYKDILDRRAFDMTKKVKILALLDLPTPNNVAERQIYIDVLYVLQCSAPLSFCHIIRQHMPKLTIDELLRHEKAEQRINRKYAHKNLALSSEISYNAPRLQVDPQTGLDTDLRITPALLDKLEHNPSYFIRYIDALFLKYGSAILTQPFSAINNVDSPYYTAINQIIKNHQFPKSARVKNSSLVQLAQIYLECRKGRFYISNKADLTFSDAFYIRRRYSNYPDVVAALATKYVTSPGFDVEHLILDSTLVSKEYDDLRNLLLEKYLKLGYIKNDNESQLISDYMQNRGISSEQAAKHDRPYLKYRYKPLFKLSNLNIVLLLSASVLWMFAALPSTVTPVLFIAGLICFTCVLINYIQFKNNSYLKKVNIYSNIKPTSLKEFSRNAGYTHRCETVLAASLFTAQSKPDSLRTIS